MSETSQSIITPELETLIRKYALQNAIDFKGRANPGAVIGKVMREQKELRSKAKELGALVGRLVAEVNALSPEEQTRAFETFAKEMALAREEKARARAEEREKGLPELAKVGKGGVVMRFAPSPSGPLHIGHTRACILNDEYVKRYGGKFILRLEDTNPGNIDLSAYELIPKDLDWLGVKYHEIVIQSDRLEIYYEYATKLLVQEAAYVCECDVEDWRSLKEQKLPCPHRDTPAEENLARWEKMLDGSYDQGEASMVVKTKLDDPNPALRDFVAARISLTSHLKTGEKYRVYPLYNFSVAIDDHLLGVTHVLRGKDHLNNTHRQKYVYDYLGWEQPEFYHYGWVSIPDTELKTSNIKKKIITGEYTGWNDVRLGTLQALKQRGISPFALRKYWQEVGMNPIDIKFSWETLFAHDKTFIDQGANRYFFTADPRPLEIQVEQALHEKAPLHPQFPERGFREMDLLPLPGETGSCVTVNIAAGDLELLEERFQKEGGLKTRLKDLGNVELEAISGEGARGRYIGNDPKIRKEGAQIIHWTPLDSLPCEVAMPDGEIVRGLVEPGILDEESEMVQFERFGYVRVEKEEKRVRAYFTHK